MFRPICALNKPRAIARKTEAMMLGDVALSHCSRSRTDSFLATMGLREFSTLEYTLEKLGSRKLFGRNEEIYGDGEKVDYFFKVVSGAVRSYKITVDGRRL